MPIQEILRNHCPNVPVLRKMVSWSRIKVLRKHLLPYSDIVRAEANPKAKKAIVEKYCQKWPAYAGKINDAISEQFEIVPAYGNRTDLDRVRTEMLFYRFAYGFSPAEYISFGLENKTKEEIAEYISDMDRIEYDCRMSDMADSAVYKDKMQTYEKFKEFYKRDAIAISSEKDLGKFLQFTQKHPFFVKKQVYESVGRGIELVDIREENISREDYFKQLIANGKHILEEKVTQSHYMSCFNESSVNTVRCIVFHTRDGVKAQYCALRMGNPGSFVDNGSAGGMFAGIDPDTGKIVTKGYDKKGNAYDKHPYTGVVFEGYQLPEWQEMIALCKRMSEQTPTVRYIGWDMTHTDHGWVVIEGNNCCQIGIAQTVAERGLKKEVLELMENMDLMVQL